MAFLDLTVDFAYSDSNIPIGHGQVMMKPIQEARFLQALGIQENEKILEIGTGSGYLTALLANLGQHVHSIEIEQELADTAQTKLQQHGVSNVTIEVGDAAEGWQSSAPYDIIVVTGSMPILSESLKNQLNIGGRMIVAVGTEPVMTVHLITRIDDEQWRQEALYETVLPQLKNVQQPQAFVF